LATRKPIVAIELEDLRAYPVWEFCADEEGAEVAEDMDETWVRPRVCSVVPSGEYALTIAARLTLAGGYQIEGFIGSTTVGGVEVTAIGVPAPRYAVISTLASAEWLEEFALAVGFPVGEVFPIHYRAALSFENDEAARDGEFLLPVQQGGDDGD
jgi:hypothetical protein